MRTPYDVLTDLYEELVQPPEADRVAFMQSVQNVILYAPALKRLTMADKDQLWRAYRSWQAGVIDQEFVRVVETIRAHYQERDDVNE